MEIFLITLAKVLSLSVVVTLLWTVQEVLSDVTLKKYPSFTVAARKT